CASCHEEHANAKHASAGACRDCHSAHETDVLADTGCARCHSQQRGAARVDAKALTAGHTRCTTCHTPHEFTKEGVAACATCHAGKPVLAATKHKGCASCH